MGTFGSTTLNGNWTLTVTDGVAGNTGTLLGWGLRFNNSVVVGTQNISELPYKFNLSQNYPNPFNPETNIKFSVPKQSKVILKIYDVLGQEVITLVNEYLAPGTYEKIFNASSFASGVYFYKLEAGEFNAVKKMVLIK
jgi:hypothetical protein